MGTPKAQHQPPPQLLFLILLSCPWIQGKDMGWWGWAHESSQGGPLPSFPGIPWSPKAPEAGEGPS